MNKKYISANSPYSPRVERILTNTVYTNKKLNIW